MFAPRWCALFFFTEIFGNLELVHQAIQLRQTFVNALALRVTACVCKDEKATAAIADTDDETLQVPSSSSSSSPSP